MSNVSSQRDLEFSELDVFTQERYKGNPLAVVDKHKYFREDYDEEEQDIAKEFNLSETVFISAKKQSSEDDLPTWLIKIFTPSAELPFAGHPLIGTACALALGEERVSRGVFSTKAGAVKFNTERSKTHHESPVAHAEIQVPFNVHLHVQSFSNSKVMQTQPELQDGDVANVDSGHPVFSITKGMTYTLIELKSLESLGRVQRANQEVDPLLDTDWAPSFVGGYFFYKAPSTSNNNFIELHTRMIEPGVGEDPVTGSAACSLAAYLATKEAKRQGTGFKREYRITQGEHMGRKGCPTIFVDVDVKGNITSMTLKGDAVRVMKGVVETS